MIRKKTRFHSIRSKELNNNPTRTLFSNMNSLPFNSKVEQINCALNSKAWSVSHIYNIKYFAQLAAIVVQCFQIFITVIVGKMKLFRYVQKYYRMVGISPPSNSSPHHQRPPFNVNNTLSLIFLTLGTILAFAYFLFEADSIEEYSRSFYGSISSLELVVYFIINFLKIQSTLKLIRKLEEFIETSEWFLSLRVICLKNLSWNLPCVFYLNRSPQIGINHHVSEIESENWTTV